MDRHLLPLAIVAALLVLSIGVALGIAVGTGMGGQLKFSADTLSSWVTALATLGIALLTVVLARESWLLRQNQLAQIEVIRKTALKPSLSVVTSPSKVGLSFLNISVKNHGPGTAQKVRFRFSNANALADDVFNRVNERIAELAIFKEGISALGPNQEVTSYFINLIELQEHFANRGLDFHCDVQIDFEDIEGVPYSTRTAINFGELRGRSSLGTEPEVEVAKSLKELQKDLHALVSGYRRLKADIYTNRDRDQMKKMIEVKQDSK